MTGGRFGLIMASYRYDDVGLRQLVAPPHDAEALAAALRDPSIGGFEVQTVINRPKYEVERLIEEFFADRRRDDLLLLYFSGHGLKDDNGRLFLAMSNTERRFLNATAVPAGFVRDAIQQSRSHQTVLVLDCCYSGAFSRGMVAKADTAVHTWDRFAATGSVVLTASDALQYSFEDDTLTGVGAGSVFTRVLVDGLTSGAADRDADGDVSLDELYDYVYEQVTSQRPEQRPGKWESGIRGRIIIAQNPRWSLTPRLQEAMRSPFPGMRRAAVEELDHLLRTGNARVVATAHRALEHLVDDDSRTVCAAAIAALDVFARRQIEAEHVRREPGELEWVRREAAEAEEAGEAEQVQLQPSRDEQARRHTEAGETADREAERSQRITKIQAQMQDLAKSRAWEAVISLGYVVARLDPNAADPDGLVTRAREQLRLGRPDDVEDKASNVLPGNVTTRKSLAPYIAGTVLLAVLGLVAVVIVLQQRQSDRFDLEKDFGAHSETFAATAPWSLTVDNRRTGYHCWIKLFDSSDAETLNFFKDTDGTETITTSGQFYIRMYKGDAEYCRVSITSQSGASTIEIRVPD